MTPDEQLVKIIKLRQGTDLHNRLMRIADRELALSMMYMQDPERLLLFSLLTPVKAERVKAELRLHDRLQIRYMQYRLAIDHVLQILNSGKKQSTLKSYLKPRRMKR